MRPGGWVVGTVAVAILGCAGDAPREVADGASASGAMEYGEPTVWAERVASGLLPAVDQRLPGNPMLVSPVEEPGRYGGSWQMAMVGSPEGLDEWLLLRTMGYENLVRWDPDWRRVLPNLAESVEADDDGTVFRFRLRDGIHWSDGEPFSVDDIMFWYEDVLPHLPGGESDEPFLTSAANPLSVERVDDLTVVFRFERPNGLFLRYLAHPLGREPTHYPRHALERFHPKYNPEVDRLVREAGASSWLDLLRSRTWPHPEAPTLFAWELHPAEADQVVAVRNPYYWKIDPLGRQLPYVDSLVYRMVQDVDQAVELAAAGHVDMQTRYFNRAGALPQLQGAVRQAGAELIQGVSSAANRMAISFNLTHRSLWKRDLYRNSDFRIGLSHAIDRARIIEDVFAGEGEPYQVAPPPGSPLYHERLGRQYTTYSPDSAAMYLDRAGLDQRDPEGFRLGPDGRRLEIVIDSWAGPGYRTSIPIVAENWRAVGIETRLLWLEREEYDQRRLSNRHDVTTWVGSGGYGAIVDPRYYLPVSYESSYAIPWATWYLDRGNPNAQEPPELTRRQMALYDSVKATVDPVVQNEYMRRVLDLSAEAFYVLGITLPSMGTGIVSSRFGNVPRVMPLAWTYPNPAPTNPSQYFVR